MIHDAEKHTGPVWSTKGDPRITKFGRFMRKVRIDEIPQAINILRGDMSFVGPRPERPFFVEKLSQEIPLYKRRLKVRPGVTGWAQVNGRNEASWDDRLRHDVWYVRNRGFLLDIKVLWMTVVKVVRREQVIVDARSTMLNLDEERAGLKVGRV